MRSYLTLLVLSALVLAREAHAAEAPITRVMVLNLESTGVDPNLTPPAKVREGYANFAIADPPLKLVLFANAGEPGTLNHVGVEVESADGDDAREMLGQFLKDGGAALRVARGGDESARLVVEPEARGFGGGDG